MNCVPITIPQMGEGLVEARIVAFLKKAGDSVRRDEPLVEMETDKAVFVVESPAEGIVGDWNVGEDETLPIGFEIGSIASENEEPPPVESVIASVPVEANLLSVADTYASGVYVNGASNGALRNKDLSPRVRAFCENNGIALDDLADIERKGDGALRVSDVESWLGAQKTTDYVDCPVTPRQKVVAQRLARAWQQAVPACIELECSWDAVQQTRAQIAMQNPDERRPSSLHLIAWCVVRAMGNHANFRSALIGANTLRQYRSVALGIAVGLPEDGLTTAPLMQADSYDFKEFGAALQSSIELARNGNDAEEGVHLTISKMTNEGIHYAVPVIVPPAASTLFIGAPYEMPRRQSDDSIRWEKIAQFVLTFDHRFINGVGAAQFLQEIQTRIAHLPQEFAAV